MSSPIYDNALIISLLRSELFPGLRRWHEKNCSINIREMIILYSCWYCAASKIQESRGPLERRRRENSSVPETEQKHNLKGPTSASVKQYSDIHPVVQMSKLHFGKYTIGAGMEQSVLGAPPGSMFLLPCVFFAHACGKKTIRACVVFTTDVFFTHMGKKTHLWRDGEHHTNGFCVVCGFYHKGVGRKKQKNKYVWK